MSAQKISSGQNLASGNLFRDFAHDAPEEASQTLIATPGIKIERIVSTGQASPPGFWYDQAWDEWVVLLSGEADLLLAAEAAPRRLGAGDYLLIPAHTRHRVERTAADQPTIWLAVHFTPG